MDSNETYDPIPLEDAHETHGPNDAGMMTHLFYAFNTVVTLQAYSDPDLCRMAFNDTRAACRVYERLLSRTLPHSDIARLNAAKGNTVAITNNTAALLRAAMNYCADSEGRFDITMGAVVQLWDFHEGIIPAPEQITAALKHVDWRLLRVWEEAVNDDRAHGTDEMQAFAQLSDPEAAIDVGGIAKGWIADALANLMAQHNVEAFIVNLGGNVIARGEKPNGSPWQIGLQDPRDKNAIVGSVAVRNASAVTSGVYERCFEREGQFYHHILDPQTGYPVKTDVAGVTVVTQRSIDAEGYSTTLLALGIERGIAFARKHSAILRACFVDSEGVVCTS